MFPARSIPVRSLSGSSGSTSTAAGPSSSTLVAVASIKAVAAFSARLDAQPFGMPLLLVAAALLETPPIHLILHGIDPGDPRLVELRAEAYHRHLPQLVVIQITDTASRAFFAPQHPVIESLPEKTAEPTAYLCENFSCRLPVTKPTALREIIAGL